MASVYQSRAGKWTAQINVDGKRRSKTFTTKTEAKRWATLEESKDLQRSVGYDHTMTFAQLANEYKHQAEKVKPFGRSKTQAIQEIVRLLGKYKLRDFNSKIFIEFCNVRRNGVTKTGPVTLGMDLTYIHTILNNGGAFCNIDTSSQLQELSKARKVLNSSGAIDRSGQRDRRPTDSELITLKHYFKSNGRRSQYWDLIAFAVTTAMRLGEICNLQWSDFDEENRMLLIRDRKDPRRKSGNHQKIPLLKGIVALDGEVLDPVEIIKSQPFINDEIFPYLKPKAASVAFTRAIRACEIDDLHFHDLRHDGISRLFEHGFAIEQVAMVSGHRSWEMLKRYTNLKPESLHNV